AADRGSLRTVRRRATEAARGRDHVIKRIVDAVKEAVEEDRTPPRRVRALGIGLPGPVDPAAGLVISPGNLPGFRNVPLNRILTRATGIASFLHHDAHLAALGEHRSARAARELAPGTPGSALHGLEHPQGEDVVRAARAGDALATAILENAGTYLGIAMGTLVNLFNPQLIVLGGSVIKAGNFLLGPM